MNRRFAFGVAQAVLVALPHVAPLMAQDLKTCLDRYEKGLTALADERQADVRNMSASFLDSLAALSEQAKAAGDAGLQQAVAAEVDRAKGGQAVANAGPEEKFAELRAARAKYEESLRLRDRGLARKIDGLTQNCDGELTALAEGLLRQGKTGEAIEVKVARTTLNSRKAVTWARRVLSETRPAASVTRPSAEGAKGASAADDKNAPYLVVDLSAGAEAKSYPVTYLNDIPAGGWDRAHKTERLVLRRIEPGTFVMGSPVSEKGRREDERQHQVTLTQAFYIGVFELTQRQWELVMGDSPGWFKKDSAARPVEQVGYSVIRGASAGAGWPADCGVDETSFMGRLRTRTGLKGFDLPTEAQWEYACRAGTETALNSGKDLTGCDSCPNVQELAVYRRSRDASDVLAKPEEGGTGVVGSKMPNRWGLYDMHGNVLEWCLDRYGPYEGIVSDPAGPKSGTTRVLRGGPWWYYDPKCASNCRSARRYDKNPKDGGKQYGWGFRVAAAPQ